MARFIELTTDELAHLVILVGNKRTEMNEALEVEHAKQEAQLPGTLAAGFKELEQEAAMWESLLHKLIEAEREEGA